MFSFDPTSVVHYPPQWECVLCEKRYSLRQPLRAHLQKVHDMSGEKFMNKVGMDEAEDLARLKGLV